MPSLVQPLVDGPIDIVGDVHGEIDVLKALLGHLGYQRHGSHAEGRHLVFLGDLTDRGPDSPAVVRLVQSLVESGNAQCVLGNHDLNLLLGDRKFDNGWFFGKPFFNPDGHLVPQVLADDAVAEMVTGFFRTLPIALERPGVRVIHAYWDRQMIEVARQATSATDLYREHKKLIDIEHRTRPDVDVVQRELDHQNRNPVKLLTSGPERKAAKAVESSGRWRCLERVEWWRGYAAPEFCIFGHYGIPLEKERGCGRAVCVDYAIGRRSLERLASAGPFKTRLAGFRLPEQQIALDDGTIEAWAQ